MTLRAADEAGGSRPVGRLAGPAPPRPRPGGQLRREPGRAVPAGVDTGGAADRGAAARAGARRRQGARTLPARRPGTSPTPSW
ncbi:hypothetical protein LV779_19035 [Streptomyces thinghirensis]|nr:hypothetical protein [Streptomyces thinghirensis]